MQKKLETKNKKIMSQNACILNIDIAHAYLSLNEGMISFPTDYIQHLKETYHWNALVIYITSFDLSCIFLGEFYVDFTVSFHLGLS